MDPRAIDSKRNIFSKRISWGAIFAGVVVVLAGQLMLSLLGVAFGAGSIDPLQEQNPASGLGTGSAIWLGISSLLALFAGGWVAARMASTRDRTESALQGVVTWGFASLAAAYLITTAVSGVLSGAAGLFGRTASLMGQSVKSMAPAIANAVGGEMSDQGVSWTGVKKEAETLLKQTKKPALQPEALERQAKNVANDVGDEELASIWSRIEARGDYVLDAVDEKALVNVVVARTGVSNAEATVTVEKWKTTLADAKAKFAEMKAKAGQKAREIGDSTAHVVSKAAAWSFVGLLLGLIAATAGGYFGAPKEDAVDYRRRTFETAESAA